MVAAAPKDSQKQVEIERPSVRRRAPIRAKITSKHYGARSFSSPIANDAAFRARLARAIGTVSPDFLEASAADRNKTERA
jgi:hypothetical protein